MAKVPGNLSCYPVWDTLVFAMCPAAPMIWRICKDLAYVHSFERWWRIVQSPRICRFVSIVFAFNTNIIKVHSF